MCNARYDCYTCFVCCACRDIMHVVTYMHDMRVIFYSCFVGALFVMSVMQDMSFIHVT